MNSNLITISECCKYIARINNNVLEIIEAISSTIHRSYDLQAIIANYLQIKSRYAPVFTQLQWEKVIPGSESAKIGIVVDNIPLLIVFDFRNTETEPIFIREPRQDGIESFEWIPPVSPEKEIGAYTNSRQLIVYSKLSLNAKVYSLDCTHVLFTIYKPITSLIIRPQHDNRFWSIFANTLEYNVPPVLYHFYNEGSVSVLIKHIRLPQGMDTTPSIEWSPSGTWLQIFNDTEHMFGYHLIVYSLLGQIDGNKTYPLIDVECMTDGVTTSEDGGVVLGISHFESNWLRLGSNKEVIAMTSVEENCLEIQFVSMNLLRIEKVVKLKLEDKQGWRQISSGFTFRSVVVPEDNWVVTQSLVDKQNLYFCFNRSYVLHFKIDIFHEEITVRLHSLIETMSKVTELEVWNGHLLVSTEEEIIMAKDDASRPKTVFKTRGTIKLFKLSDNTAVVTLNTTQGASWQVVSLQDTKPSPIKRKHLGNTSITLDEVTDTFVNKKRNKTK
ncbi:hypothetical protein Cantr_08643 [Candida viswanathii]|uniref:Uncharacterized protein n=1 Tax=Candida viswanathii TaxID=5486 RepID=A0A367XPT8_9ASCO|nr:hypothetical protein Cantr_05003 [Candida viswanathii]RCK60535.1 hypothetical protein Cantr_08643 [Candida viswanathii]